MLKVGDKVVCVRADNTSIKLNRIYTIIAKISIFYHISAVTVEVDILLYQHKNCFMSIKEYRKLKLNKLDTIIIKN